MSRPTCPGTPAPPPAVRRSAAALPCRGGARLLRRLTAAALLLTLGAAALAAAPQDRRWQAWAVDGFQHITSADGLPNEIATSVAEDGQGFIWAGTVGGVARWDGYQLRVHRFEPGRAGSLPDNVVQVMHRDAGGRLWIGTSGGGLARYEPTGERFITTGAGPGGLAHVSVRALADDGNGGLWVGTDGGLDHIDGASGRVTPVATGDGSISGLAGQRVVALLRDRAGRLWAGSSHGLFRRDAGAARFEAVPLVPAPAQRDAASAMRPVMPESLLEDSAGRLWVGTDRLGAFVLDADGRNARAVQESDRPANDGKTLVTRRVMTLAEARPGEIWIGTLGQGIVAVDAASGHTRRLSHQPLAAASLPDDSVRGLLRDRQGLIWAATYGGLSRIDPRTSALLTVSGSRLGADIGRARADYSALLAHPDGRVWMGTHVDGVTIVDPVRGTVQLLRPDVSRPDTALQADVVMSLVADDDGSVFVGGYRGLYRASADGRRVNRLRWPGRRPDAGIGPMLRDGAQLWVGGLTDGLWALDMGTGATRAVLDDPARQLTDLRITALARGSDGALWIGTRNGLNRLRPATGDLMQLVPGLPAEGRLATGFVTALHFDPRGRLWVATYGGGVHVLEPGSETAPRFRRVTMAEGLPDDNVNALAADDAGQLWASTDLGLARIDPDTLKARALRRADGLVFQSYWTGSVARTAAGEVLFGASGGLTVVRPALLQAWDHRPAVVVTDIQVGGQRVPPGGSTTALQVPADANSLVVEFAALDYSAPERNRYAHRLRGYDDDWVQTDARHRVAGYANLPPGDYVLELRGSNRDGVFADATLALPVQVQAAWHQAAAVRIAATLAAAGGLWGVVALRTRTLQTRRRELQRLVDERTAELRAVSQALTEKSRALEEKSLVLERASISDPLTGLHNRRFLTEQIEGMLAASQRRAHDRPAPAGAPVDTDTLFFMIDVDHFKRVNDELGHAAGDAVLVQLAQRLRVAMRESDDIVRWGGEEFLAVAHDTDRARADELAERIRASVADNPFRLSDGRLLAMTCSVGHACWPFLPQHPQALDWLGVVDVADIGLLAAKRLGRNAWVGMHGTERTPPAALLTLARRKPHQALARGELRASSNQPAAAVAEALQAP